MHYTPPGRPLVSFIPQSNQTPFRMHEPQINISHSSIQSNIPLQEKLIVPQPSTSNVGKPTRGRPPGSNSTGKYHSIPRPIDNAQHALRSQGTVGAWSKENVLKLRDPSPEVNVISPDSEDVDSLPKNYKEVTNHPEAKKWLEAMKDEMNSMAQNKVWRLVPLPEGKKTIKCKWVFVQKRDETGVIVRYKARLVAKSCTQKKGVDYEEVYSPVSSIETVRLMAALQVLLGWESEHADVITAYLHGRLNETVYMEQPEGFVTLGQEHLVCILDGSIYGLKQSDIVKIIF